MEALKTDTSKLKFWKFWFSNQYAIKNIRRKYKNKNVTVLLCKWDRWIKWLEIKEDISFHVVSLVTWTRWCRKLSWVHMLLKTWFNISKSRTKWLMHTVVLKQTFIFITRPAAFWQREGIYYDTVMTHALFLLTGELLNAFVNFVNERKE